MVKEVTVNGDQVIIGGNGALVASKSEPGGWHIVRNGACDCRGYQYRSHCRHLVAAILMFETVTERAGLAGLGIVPHSMRHGLAVDLLKGGADLRVVQEVLGHATIVTTQIYTKIENSHLEEGYRKRKSLQDRPIQTVH